MVNNFHSLFLSELNDGFLVRTISWLNEIIGVWSKFDCIPFGPFTNLLITVV